VAAAVLATARIPLEVPLAVGGRRIAQAAFGCFHFAAGHDRRRRMRAVALVIVFVLLASRPAELGSSG